MKLRFYLDPDSGDPHIYRHGVVENEVEAVLSRPIEDRLGRDASRVAVGPSDTGRYLRVVYVPDPIEESVVRGDRVRAWTEGAARDAAAEKEEIKKSKYPQGWDQKRVRRLLEHYESQTPEEAIAEDEAAHESPKFAFVEVPFDLVPSVRRLLAKRKRGVRRKSKSTARRRTLRVRVK